MGKRKIVVVGGALSGPTAAARARETDESASIVLLERARDVSYAVGGLGHHLSGEVPSIDALNRERAAFFRDVYRDRGAHAAPPSPRSTPRRAP